MNEELTNKIAEALREAKVYLHDLDNVAESLRRNPNLIISLRAKDAKKGEDNFGGLLPQKEAKESFYQFTVTDVAQIDLNRIVKEQYKAGNLVTLLTDGKTPEGLFVRREFLAPFSKEDNLMLAGELLHPDWGFTIVSIRYAHRTFYLEKPQTSEEEVRELEAARFRRVEQPLDKIAAELAAARAFTRKITVKVHAL